MEHRTAHADQIATLRQQLADQAQEIARLRERAAELPSRRALLTGGAAAAGGALALSAVRSAPAHAVDGHDIQYPAAGETAHLTLTAAGVAVPGDSTQASLGRENTIECFYFQQKARTVVRKSGAPTVKLDHVVIRKRVDRASPRLAEAQAKGSRLAGQFRFFRPNPTGDGTTEQHFTVAFTGGRVMWRDIFLPDLMVGAGRGAGGGAPYEEVGMRLSGVSWTYTNGGITWPGDG